MRTRIAFFLPNLTGGGAEKVSVNLLREMINYKDLEIDLLLGNATGSFMNEVPQGINIINFQSNRLINTIPSLVKYLRNSKPDSLLAHISHTNVIALIAKQLSNTNVKIFVVEHNNLSARDTPSVKSMALRPIMRWVYPTAERVIGVSEGVSNTIQEHLRLDPSKTTTIHNPVVMPEILDKSNEDSTHPWLSNNDLPVFLGVGRFTEQKDFDNLLQAFAVTLDSIQARLIILGDGPLRPKLEKKIQALSLSNNVSLPGFCDNPYSYMSKVACFVLSSRYEGLPTVLIEAMACGCNVVSTDCPSGPDEILENGKFGKLVPVGDDQSLASAMIESIKSPISPQSLQKRASAFTPKVVVPQYVSLLAPMSCQSHRQQG